MTTLQKDSPEETLQEAYPEEWNLIKDKKIPRKEIEKFLIDFIQKILKEIKAGKRDDLDIGDAFPLSAFAYNRGYRFSKEFDNFLMNLGEYKTKHSKQEYYLGPLNSIAEVESVLFNFKD